MRVIQTTVYTFDELSDKAKEKAREWYRGHIGTDPDMFESTIEDFCEIVGFLGVDIGTKPVRLMNGKTRYEPMVYWSGFGCQGDGACFAGSFNLSTFKPVSLAAWGGGETVAECLKDAASMRADILTFYRAILKCTPMQAWPDVRRLFTSESTRVNISQSGRYTHQYTMSVNGAEDIYNNVAYYCGDRMFDESALAHACEVFASAVQEFVRGLAHNLYHALDRENDHQNEDSTVDENIRANEYEFTIDGARA